MTPDEMKNYGRSSRYGTTEHGEHLRAEIENLGYAELAGLSMAGLRALQVLSWRINEETGWHHDPETGEKIEMDVPRSIALCHSELSEALEAFRKSLPDDKLPDHPGIEVELCDLIIRTADLAHSLGFDLGATTIEKMGVNRSRADHGTESRSGPGGKAF